LKLYPKRAKETGEKKGTMEGKAIRVGGKKKTRIEEYDQALTGEKDIFGVDKRMRKEL